MRPRPIEVLAAVASLVAGAAHGLVAERHFEEWWAYGAFFVVAALLQSVYGLILLALPKQPDWEPGAWPRFRARLFWAGLVLNVATLALYVVTRTVGVPVGPAAGDVEAVGTVDLVSKAAESLLVACLASLLWHDRHAAKAPAGRATPKP